LFCKLIVLQINCSVSSVLHLIIPQRFEITKLTMRITFVVASLDLSGGARVIATYAERLQARGHTVLVVARAPFPPSWRDRLKHFQQGKGWLSTPPACPSHFDHTNVPIHLISPNRPVTDADVPDADVVIATWWETAEWVAQLSPQKGKKAYFIQHHEVFPYMPVERVKATYNLPLRKIVVSNWLATVMRSEYGDRNVATVPNSVDTAQFHAMARSRQVQPTVGFIYSATAWKGSKICLDAFHRAAAQIPNLRLLVFGDPIQPELPLPETAQHYFYPPQSTLKDLYSSADVWICGSQAEGFCLPLLEAMACRTPVVTTTVGGAVDVVQEGKNGYIVPVDDAAALAECIVRVLSQSEAEWQMMSEVAHETAIAYTWNDATDEFEAVLQQLARQENRLVEAGV
jgi:glycosyltransferase involved in cell wall biosynthesis